MEFPFDVKAVLPIGRAGDSGGGWRLRLMRAVTVRLPGLSLILATRELPYERRPPPGNLLLSE